MGKLFGTDGVRGVANTPPMDSDTVLRLGRAAAYVFRRSEGRHRIVIGKDTRVSGYMLESALASGITSMGVDVLLLGPLPTPGVAFMTRSMRADAGVMISASHNPYEDNGIKFFGCDGFKLADETEAEMERLMEPGSLDQLRATPELVGKAFRVDDALGRYTVYLKSCIERDFDLEGLKIVVDSANGAAYKISRMVFAELGADVICLGDKPDGKNINRNCGSLYPEHIAEKVVAEGADLGIAFDGDADRVIICDERGRVLDGDLLLLMCACDFLETGRLKGDGVVATVMSNFGLEKALLDRGLKLYRSSVGDRYVLGEMRAMGINLGGEQSGHIIALDYNTTGDGILTALLVLSIVLRRGKPLSDFLGLMERYPQELINVPVAKKVPFEELPALSCVVEESRRALGSRGRVLLRYSGTEKLARVMVECENDVLCRTLAERIAETLQRELAV